MILLLLFSFVAGVITILSPCILSILPILLSTTTTKESHKPLGIIIGLVASFSFFTLCISSIVHITGIPPDVFRYCAIGIILFFGLTMVIPFFENFFNKITARLTRIGSHLETTTSQSTGFLSGCLLGASLGLVWTPCAGPILATVTTFAATQGISLTALAMILAYSSGAALPMFIIMHTGNRVINQTALGYYAHIIKKIFGIIIIMSALAMIFNLDTKLQTYIADYFPSLSIENNPLISKELKQLNISHGTIMHTNDKAPDFVGIDAWLNSRPLTLQQLRGKVVLVDFWTYSCINCIRTLPHLKQWYQTYKNHDFEIIGIHTPEFAFEKSSDNVRAAIKKFDIPYPVALDNNYATWQAYDNHYWPAHYLINQEGTIVYHHFGEGNYQETENKIRQLLGLSLLKETEKQEIHKSITPETYLGYARADRYHPDIVFDNNNAKNYHYTPPLPHDHIGLTGTWSIKNDAIVSQENRCTLELNFTAHSVYLVMESETPQEVTVLLDGKQLQQSQCTKDMKHPGTIMVHEPRMYEIVNCKKEYENHLLSLQFPKNVTAYVFTFG